MKLHDYVQNRAERSPKFRQALQDRDRRKELVRSLVDRRNEMGLSQTQVATHMETTQSAVSELESGNSDPRLSTLQRFASALDHHLVVVLVRNGHNVVDGYPSQGEAIKFSNFVGHSTAEVTRQSQAPGTLAVVVSGSPSETFNFA